MSKIIFITGVSGFLGAHIAESLLKKGNQIVALIRKSSDLWRCNESSEKIIWLYADENDWQKKIINLNPTVFIHCAWIGVNAAERDDWQIQNENIAFADSLLVLTKSLKLEKFICLGSQAEYGFINQLVDESFPTNPNTAYGEVKLKLQMKIQKHCEEHAINWVWLRVFSVFGPLENQNWLIPSLITKMKTGSEMDMTEGKQVYAYLYVEDFKIIVQKIVEKNIHAGVYNVCALHTLSLKHLAEKLRAMINPSFKINFGVLPYRAQQSMHIQGEITKLMNEIGEIPFTDINFALSKTIESYISKTEKL
jgi:nucleoside-diphosphate-sugar epimerase